MKINQIIHELRQIAPRNARCLICNHNPRECENMGCQVMLQAADALELVSGLVAEHRNPNTPEKQAIFRLGQMDMRESAAAALRKAADGTHGITCSSLLAAADLILELEVADRAEG